MYIDESHATLARFVAALKEKRGLAFARQHVADRAAGPRGGLKPFKVRGLDGELVEQDLLDKGTAAFQTLQEVVELDGLGEWLENGGEGAPPVCRPSELVRRTALALIELMCEQRRPEPVRRWLGNLEYVAAWAGTDAVRAQETADSRLKALGVFIIQDGLAWARFSALAAYHREIADAARSVGQSFHPTLAELARTALDGTGDAIAESLRDIRLDASQAPQEVLDLAAQVRSLETRLESLEGGLLAEALADELAEKKSALKVMRTARVARAHDAARDLVGRAARGELAALLELTTAIAGNPRIFPEGLAERLASLPLAAARAACGVEAAPEPQAESAPPLARRVRKSA